MRRDRYARSWIHIYEAAVWMIERYYINNLFGCGTDEDMYRLMGEVLSGSYIKFEETFSTIMAHGGFNIKYMVRDREDHPKILEQFYGAILGTP